MVVLQISLSEENYKYVKDLMVKAQGSFQLDGEKYTLGLTFIRILEEWSKNKGYIKNTTEEKKHTSLIDLILNDPIEYNALIELIELVEKEANPGKAQELWEYVRSLDKAWRPPKDESVPKALVVRMKEIIAEAEKLRG